MKKGRGLNHPCLRQVLWREIMKETKCIKSRTTMESDSGMSWNGLAIKGKLKTGFKTLLPISNYILNKDPIWKMRGYQSALWKESKVNTLWKLGSAVKPAMLGQHR